MKASAGSATRVRDAATLRQAPATRRSAAPVAAKAQVAAKKTAAPVKPAAAKVVAKPATKVAAKPTASKPAPTKPESKPAAVKPEAKPVVSKPAVAAAPKPAAPPPPQMVQEKAPPPPPQAPPPPVATGPALSAADRRPPMPDRLPPRPPAKAEIFVEGDHVVYPTHGVGKVERIATEEIAGHKLELIHITFEENRMTLRVPVAKARSAGLRKLATRKLFDEALAVLKGRARIKRTMWSRRAQEYEAKINSGDPLAIAEVVRDLHRNAGQPDQSFSERQIYEAAMDRLAAELAALDKTDKVTAATKLTNFLKTV